MQQVLPCDVPERYVQYALLCLVAMVGYADRINMSVAVLGMADELGWTLHDRGAAMAAFFYGYCVFQVPAAIAVRWYGARMVQAWCIGAWCVLTAATPLAARNGPISLVIVRALLGVAEAPVGPAGMHIIALWAPPQERARAVAVQGFGFFLGTVFALAVSPTIMTTWGWPNVFYFFSIVGMILLGFWLQLAQDVPSLQVETWDTAATPNVATDSEFNIGVAPVGPHVGTHMPSGIVPASVWRPIVRQMLSSSGAWAVFVLHFLHSVGR